MQIRITQGNKVRIFAAPISLLSPHNEGEILMHPNILSYKCSVSPPPPIFVSPPSPPTPMTPTQPGLTVPGVPSGDGSTVFGSEPTGSPNAATSSFYSLPLLLTCGLLASLQIANYI